MREPVLRTEHLDAGYGRSCVVQGLSLELFPCEIVALIGPNGTGKSTVLKTVSGQLRPLSGKVFLKGRELSAVSSREISKTMSLLMTEKVDPELMTCGEVVSIGRYPYTGLMGRLSEQDEDVIREAMELAHVTELKDRYYTQISDGQKQRVLLARAICQEPEVLIMDEPTSFLDIKHKLELLKILLKLVREREVAVLVSLHEIELAKKVADRVVCLSGGRAEVFSDPREVFTKDRISGLFGISGPDYDWMYGQESGR